MKPGRRKVSTARRTARRHEHFRREAGRDNGSAGIPSAGRCPESGKLRYLDEDTADRMVAWGQAHPVPGQPVPERSYPCSLPLCGSWHVTSQVRAGQR